MKNTFLVTLIASTLALSGCVSTGAFTAANLTEVQLTENNYEIVATNVRGEATAGYLLGVSAGMYGQISTVAVARVSGSGMIYGDALQNLWANFADAHGPIEGRNLALVNVRYDTDALNLILYTAPTVYVYADVVEFTE